MGQSGDNGYAQGHLTLDRAFACAPAMSDSAISLAVNLAVRKWSPTAVPSQPTAPGVSGFAPEVTSPVRENLNVIDRRRPQCDRARNGARDRNLDPARGRTFSRRRRRYERIGTLFMFVPRRSKPS